VHLLGHPFSGKAQPAGFLGIWLFWTFGASRRLQRAGMPFGAGGVGSLVFDYGARTIRMAPSLYEAEAKMLVKEFSTRLKGNRQ
jgi:hypothetical protein